MKSFLHLNSSSTVKSKRSAPTYCRLCDKFCSERLTHAATRARVTRPSESREEEDESSGPHMALSCWANLAAAGFTLRRPGWEEELPADCPCSWRSAPLVARLRLVRLRAYAAALFLTPLAIWAETTKHLMWSG